MPQYKAHLFICTNLRQGGKECCAARGGQQLRDELKSLVKQNPSLRAIVRVNNSGCLDQCSRGITAVLYPQGKWFVNLSSTDAPKLLKEILSAVKSS